MHVSLSCCCAQFHVAGRAPVYTYSNAFCEGGQNGTGVYYLASAGRRQLLIVKNKTGGG
jgi:hypothetical protein